MCLADARDLYLVIVVIVGSGLYVGPRPSPLLRTYQESGSRELGGIRSDQVVGRTKKAKNNTWHEKYEKNPQKKCDDDTCRDLLGKTEGCMVALGKLGLVRSDRTGKYDTGGSIGGLVLGACLQQPGGPIRLLATDVVQ